MMDTTFLAELERIVGPDGTVTDAGELLTYQSDGLVRLRERPAVAVLPDTVEQVQQVVRLCHRSKVPFVARGSGTGLSGGALPHPDGVLIVMTRLNRVLDIDLPNQRITVEPGVLNLEVTRRVASEGYYYAPDPSSQVICSIGGNVAENSGGAHCLKYGFTVHHVMGVEVVLPDGELVRLGGEALDSPGLDLLGVLVGSEGTLGVVTKVTLRLLRRPETVQTLLAAFDSTDAAGNAVSDIISAGIIPAAIEMMDRTTIRAAEAAVHPGFPDAEAVLIVELDGPRTEVAALFAQVEEVCTRNAGWGLQVARDEAQRARIWMGRKAAFAAMGADFAELLRPGRRDSAQPAPGSTSAHPSARDRFGSDDRQRVPCRRRQPAPARLLRRRGRRTGRAGRAGRHRDLDLLSRCRGVAHRRARRRRRQGVSDAQDVHPRGSGDDAVRPWRIRSRSDL